MKHLKRKQPHRGIVIGAVLTVVFLVVLGGAYLLPMVQGSTPSNTPVAETGSEGEPVLEEGNPVVGAASTDPEILEELNGTPASAVYEAEVPFDLTGVPLPSDSEKPHENYNDSWSWLGTMNVTISKPMLYDSLEAAGYTEDPERFASTEEMYADCKLVVVDITVENIDATCREEDLEGSGVPAFNTWMFHLESSAGGYGTYADANLISAPPVEDIAYGPYTGRSYTWVEPGETITIRMGYYVAHDEPAGDVANSYKKVDDTPSDPDYTLVLDASGWRWGAPEVKLGKAVPADVAQNGGAS